VAVVDQHIVSSLQHGSEDSRCHRQVVATAVFLAGDDNRLADLQINGRLEVTDPDLRALEICDQRERASRSIRDPRAFRARS
jgi:hypothetical protein